MTRKNTWLLYRIIGMSVHIKRDSYFAMYIMLRQILRANRPKAEQQHNGDTATKQ